MRIIALDYDGTVAKDGRFDPDVRAAVEEARARGIVVILVTGRILGDLRRVAGDLRLFDVVVAENGALLFFPEGRRTTLLGPTPPGQLLAELRRRGIQIGVGACIVEAAADAAPEILSVIRAKQLPLVLLFNGGRVMVLPQGVSKATGLHQALRILRLSEHNAIAIGDAENDHALLGACEIGAAVAWGSEALKASADEILLGDGPPAVAAYIRQRIARARLSPEVTGRRKLLLGQTSAGETIELAVKGRNVLIVGEPRSGKSWAAGLLCEQLILRRYSVCVIDPEGDYTMLGSLPGVVVLGGGSAPPSFHEVELALRHPELSVVVDLSKLGSDDKREYVQSLLPRLAALRRRTGLPHRIVVDEAHYFLHVPDLHTLLDLEIDGYTFVTYRLSDINPAIWEGTPPVIATRLRDADDIRLLQTRSGGNCEDPDWPAALGSLANGEVMLLPNAAEAAGKLQRCRLAPRLTSHVRHQLKYVDVPVSEHHAFVLTRDGVPLGPRARTLRGFVQLIAAAPEDALSSHLQRGDVSRWIREVFGDDPLAAQINELEQSFSRASTEATGRAAIIGLIEERYSVDGDECGF